MPAGLVLIILVGALLGGTLLNADATLRKASAQNKGPWRVDVAQDVQTLSSLLHTDVPHNQIDQALGHTDGRVDATDSADALLAQKRQEEAATSTTAAPTPGGPPPTAPSDTPHLRPATPANPLKLEVLGDSVAGSFAPGMQDVAKLTGQFSVKPDFQVSSGLVVDSFFNWPKHLVEVTKADNPDVMMVMFGANDFQNISLDPAHALKAFSAEWLAEYRKRVGTAMDLMKSPKNDRLVVWVGQPIMSPRSPAVGMDQLDYIFATEAAKRPWVVYFDSWPYFTDDQGNYAARLPAADGSTQTMRTTDGVHLTPSGADRLAFAVNGKLSTVIDMTQTKLTAPPLSDMAPPDVHERPEVPKPPGMQE
jgi:hypothetical protein